MSCFVKWHHLCWMTSCMLIYKNTNILGSLGPVQFWLPLVIPITFLNHLQIKSQTRKVKAKTKKFIVHSYVSENLFFYLSHSNFGRCLNLRIELSDERQFYRIIRFFIIKVHRLDKTEAVNDGLKERLFLKFPECVTVSFFSRSPNM